MEDVLTYFQIGANAFALLVAGWIYAAYIRNLKSIAAVKTEQVALLEKNIAFWKDKAAEFEKQTPAYVEEMLAARIKHREEEMARLAEDRDQNMRLLKSRSAELDRLRAELEKARGIGRAITYYDLDSEQEMIIPDSELELEEMGELYVDSASLFIGDPMYIRDEWRDDVKYEDLRLYKHARTGRVYQYQKDFTYYDDVIKDLGQTPNDLIQKGELIPVELEREYTMSLPGAMYASSSKKGYGVMKFAEGHDGAGLCVRTVYGDGVYSVYGERYKGKIVRVYIDLQ